MDFVKWLEGARRSKQGQQGNGKKPPVNVTVINMMSPRELAAMGGSPSRPFSTGAGPDGIVQPDRPAMLDTQTNPPSVYHEGETIVPFKGGKHIIPAQTPAQQEELAEMQAREGLPGYQTGGTTYNNADPQNTDPQNTGGNNTGGGSNATGSNRTNFGYDLSPVSNYQTDQRAAYQDIRNVSQGNDDRFRRVANRAQTDYDMRANLARTTARQNASSSPYMTENAKRATMAGLERDVNIGRAGLYGDLAMQNVDRMDRATQQVYDLGREQVQDEQARQRYADTRADTAQSQARQSFFDAAEMGDDATVRAAYEEYFGQAMDPNASVQDIREYARTMRAQNVTRGEQAITAADLGITAQENDIINDMVAKGYNRTQINAELQRMGATIMLSPTDLENMRATTNYGMWKTEFDENNSRYQDSQDWTAYKEAVASGNFNVAADIYNNLTGKELSTDQWTFDQNAVNRETTARVESIENRLGDEKFDSVLARLDAGLPWNPEIEKLYGVTEEEYAAMRPYSAAGTTDINRKTNAANVLLELGGEENIQKAGEMLNEAFPWMVDADGNGIDMSQVLRDENAQYVTTAMGEIAGYISGTRGLVSWDDFKSKNQGLIDNWMASSGMDEGQIALMYSSMRTNSIDVAIQRIKGSDFYNSMPPDRRELYDAVLEEALTGTLDYALEETGQYWVEGQGGNVVATFDSQADADAFVQNNAGLGYKTTPATRLVTRDMLEDDPDDQTAGTTGLSVSEWEDLSEDEQYAKYRASFEGSGVEPYIMSAWRFAGKPFDVAAHQEYEEGPEFIRDGKNVGDTYFYQGQMYRKMSNDGSFDNDQAVNFRTDDITDDTEYAWGPDADDVLEAGKEGNPYYDMVLDARVDDVLQRKVSCSEIRLGDPVFYAVKSQAADWSPRGKWDDGRRVFNNTPSPGTYYVLPDGLLGVLQRVPNNDKAVFMVYDDNGWREKIYYPRSAGS